MNPIRTVLIGYGGMGRQDADLLYRGHVEGMVLVGICCRNQEGQQDIRLKYPGVRIYKSAEEMFADADYFDALVIVTPHRTHVELALQAAQLGKHILVDKPIGVSTQEAKVLLRTAQAHGVSVGVIFNMRVYPVYQKVKQILQQGRLGTLHRAVWMMNSWYRSPAYHHSSKWRSSWNGECGGMLINQCQHPLDLWQWLFGMPDELYASITYGKYNDFLVDDSADIQLEYSSGFHGTFIASTGEAPGVNRLEIWGSRGKLCIEDNARLTFYENAADTEAFAKHNQDIYGHPGWSVRELSIEQNAPDSYQVLFHDFAEHIRNGTPMLADGEDGLRALMLANGAYLSSWLHRSVTLPIDDMEYLAMLQKQMDQELQQHS